VPRTARVDAPGILNHVTARGIERRLIFADDRDRAEFVRRLAKVLVECSIDCFAWALMPNHVHLVLRTGEVPLARAMARLLTGYAVYFNRRHERAGHLFQNRYGSILVDSESHLMALIRYVHLNPVRSGLIAGIGDLSHYPWTGHAVLMGNGAARFQVIHEILERFGTLPARARQRLERWMSLEDDRESSLPAREDAQDASVVVDRLCGLLGTEAAALRSRPPCRRASDTRAITAYLACVAFGYSQGAVGRALGVSQQAIHKAVRKGSDLVDRSPHLSRLRVSLVEGREEG